MGPPRKYCHPWQLYQVRFLSSLACTLILIVCIMWNMCRRNEVSMYNMISMILYPLGQRFLKVHTSWWTFDAWTHKPGSKSKGSNKFGPMYKLNCVDLGFGFWTFNERYNNTDLYNIPCDQHFWGISLFPVSVSS